MATLSNQVSSGNMHRDLQKNESPAQLRVPTSAAVVNTGRVDADSQSAKGAASPESPKPSDLKEKAEESKKERSLSAQKQQPKEADKGSSKTTAAQ